jgi:hypothetical protein
MICVECGTENARAVQVCAVCGAPPVGAREASADQAEDGPGGYAVVTPGRMRDAARPPARPDRWFLLIFLACCLMLVICGIVGSNVPPQSPWAGKVALTSGIIVCGAVTCLALFWHARRRIRLERAEIGVRADDIMKVLESRQLEPTPQQRELLAGCSDLLLARRWFDRALTAATVDEVFAD